MSVQEKLNKAFEYAMKNRPEIGGFPFLAECLRQAGVEKNIWSLPSAQSVYVMKDGTIAQPGQSLVAGMVDVASFDEEALLAAIRTDQAGQSTFPEFLMAIWNAGVISYEVDFSARTVSYFGARGERYIESYPEVEIGDMDL